MATTNELAAHAGDARDYPLSSQSVGSILPSLSRTYKLSASAAPRLIDNYRDGVSSEWQVLLVVFLYVTTPDRWGHP